MQFSDKTIVSRIVLAESAQNIEQLSNLGCTTSYPSSNRPPNLDRRRAGLRFTTTFFTLPLARSIIGRHVYHNNTLMMHSTDIIQVINWCLACLAVLLSTGVCKCCTSIAEEPSCAKEFEPVLTCTV